jgi:hypothetical protein
MHAYSRANWSLLSGAFIWCATDIILGHTGIQCMHLDLIYEEFIAGFCKLFPSQYLMIISLLLWKGHESFFFVLVVGCCTRC